MIHSFNRHLRVSKLSVCKHHHTSIENISTLWKTNNLKEATGSVQGDNQPGISMDYSAYASLLQECVKSKALAEGKSVHCIMIKTGFRPDVYLQAKLVIMYAKCETMIDACRVFDNMSEQNAVSWNAMISGYAQKGRLEEARRCFDKMPQQNIISWNTMITTYARNGRLEKARQLFDEMPERDVISWNAMIAGYAQNEQAQEVLKLFSQMQSWGINPNPHTITGVLSACTIIEALDQGKQIHAYIIKKQFECSIFVGSALVNIYAKCGIVEDLDKVFDSVQEKNMASCNAAISGYANYGRIDYARRLFDRMTERNVVTWTAMLAGYIQNGRIADACKVFYAMREHNVVSWTAMIAGYVQEGFGEEAVELFSQMQSAGIKPNESTLSSVTSACADMALLEQGMQVHVYIIKMGFEHDAFVRSALVDMYVKCVSIDNANCSFVKMSEQDVVSSNVMITAYALCGRIYDAERLFDKMSEPDVVSWNAMIAAYCQNGRLEDAYLLFMKMPAPGVVSWTTMIMGYAQNGKMDDAYQLFDQMPGRDVVAWTAMISGYVHNWRIEDARQLFDKMPERNVISWNVMIAGYAQHGMTEEARLLFDSMPDRNVASWSAMTSGYVQNGYGEEALKFYSLMQQLGMKPSLSIFTNVISACAQLAAMEQGKQIHVDVIKFGLDSDIIAANSLITMYAKCGSLTSGCQIFEEMPEHDAISWNAMISGYALHGFGKEVMQLFEKMQQAGVIPDQITFVTVLSACSHAGLINEGWHYFNLMIQEYCIIPRADHYACMVDLLGRAGFLDEAKEFINHMPIEPDAVVWGALLGACRIHGDVELGKHVAEQLVLFEPQNAATYVTLSNIYGRAGSWDDVAKVRIMMKEKGIEKAPGCSWIEVKNRVHAFLVGDNTPIER